jgi:hypothetical protein
MSAKVQRFLNEYPIAYMVQRLVHSPEDEGILDTWIRYAVTLSHYAGSEPSGLYPVNRCITITEQEELRKNGHPEPILSIYHRIRRTNPASNRDVLEDLKYTIQVYRNKLKVF